VKSDIGLIGLGVMGQNLVLNMVNHGYSVSVFNRTLSVVDEFTAGKAEGYETIRGTHSIQELAESLAKPRRIMLMVKAGRAVDAVIEQLVPYLSPGDIIIDCGNSYFNDSIRRSKALEEEGFLYLGVGVSGGEEGALKGPSIMPGGSKAAWKHVEKIFTDIAARAGSGEACCRYLGPDGAGHFVKMVHNGIEYADMELIAEAYAIMKNLFGMSAEEMEATFAQWSKGDLSSYLIEITRDILGKKDKDTGRSIVDVIKDAAGQKGTGKWTSQEALELGVPAPTLVHAVFARCMSALKDERVQASAMLKGPAQAEFADDRVRSISHLRAALYASKICAYAEGFALLREASREYGWNLDLGGVALLWRGGCIIRAQFLERITDAFNHNPNLTNLILDPYFKNVIISSQDSWRLLAIWAIQNGIPVPAFASALSYYDSYRAPELPANLIQAQRDYFGAHTYERVDRPGTYHTDWLAPGDIAESLESK
jgi:6-phosphogluconate dehydrogenase